MLNFTEFVNLYQAYEQYVAQQVQPHVKQPVQQPVQPHVKQPVQQPVQPQVQQPVQQPVQTPVQQPVQPVQPVQTPVQQPVQQPVQPVQPVQQQPDLAGQLAALQSTVDMIANRPPQVNGQPKVQTIDDIILGMVK